LKDVAGKRYLNAYPQRNSSPKTGFRAKRDELRRQMVFIVHLKP
jgi:hypothetical protein